MGQAGTGEWPKSRQWGDDKRYQQGQRPWIEDRWLVKNHFFTWGYGPPLLGGVACVKSESKYRKRSLPSISSSIPSHFAGVCARRGHNGGQSQGPW